MSFLLGIILLLLVGAIVLSLPATQTKLAKYITQQLNKDFGTDITVEQASISVFGGMKLKKIMVKDHKKDTLFYINRLKTNILDYQKLIDGDLTFGDIRLDGLDFHLKNYKGEKDSNLDKFIALFDDGKPSKSKKKFLLTSKNIYVTNSHFILTDNNLSNPKILNLRKLNAQTANFKVLGPDVSTIINQMSFVDQRGLIVNDLNSHFTYTKKNIILDKLKLETPESKLDGDIVLRYKREDFSDFNNKVVFDIKVNQASLSSNDLKLFYGEFGINQRFDFSSKIIGTLNDFSTQKLKLKDNNNSEIIGDFTFKNLFSKKKNDFYMKGDINKISSTYNNLTAILPKILGENLPTTFKKFGTFTISGKTEVTLKTIKADVILNTDLGKVQSVLDMTNINNIDNATYLGNIKLENFNLGKLLNRSDLGVVNLNLDVDGKGFTQKFLNTKLKGTAQSIVYNNYNYKNISIDGIMNSSIFKGNIATNDPNLKMNFDGVLDISNREKKYDFHANVEYANLEKLKFYTADSIAVFRGDVVMKLQGNSIDNLYGEVYINQTSYENGNDTYFFDDFVVKSTFDENRVRTMTINSPDIIEGKVVGKFQFNQLQKLIENSLGSLYANYSPNKVNKGQFLKFDFNVYNKLIEVFYPEVSLGENTIMRGTINSDNDDFKFNFKSPRIKAYDNYFENINIEIDNKNPLYNAYVELDSIKTKHYTVSDFSLINVTANDTLFFRSEFKGGKKGNDFYNLNMYHTINEENNSVVGIKKSEINFKDYLWFINENESKDNKIIFNKKLTDFSIEKIAITHEKQAMELMGVLRDSTYKDLKLSFKDVDLDKITPAIDSLKIKGKVNGLVNFKQNKSIYEPSSTITVDSLSINKFALGKLAIDVQGDNTFKNFKINSILKNDGLESFSADGNVSIDNKKTFLDLNLRLDQFNMSAFSPLGGEVIKNIRGFASGTAKFEGEFQEPEITGRLYLNEAGLKIPYLNVDYNFKNNSIVDVTENQFAFRSINISDVKYKTKGILNGGIRHTKFADWFLDLNISSDRIVVLDTKDADDALYYGTAFIDGDATIKGPVNGLVINVDATSEKGTSIKIPISDSESTSERDFIKFKSATDGLAKNLSKKIKINNGLELNFQLNITKEAEIEVIINKSTGHSLKGRGYGDILMEINTLGKFNMYGDFIVDKGEYNFKYGGIIDKKFIVKPLGSISWEGNPLNAILNMEAVYKTEANPGILLDNSSFTKKIPTEVSIKLTDKLTNPVPEISINFPTVSSVLKSDLDFKLSDSDTRQKQAIYLLSTGGFLSDSGVDGTALTGNLLETAKGLFDGIFSSEDDKFKVNPYYVQGNNSKNLEDQSSGQVGFTLSTQISEKVTLNGKLGVPVGGVNESAIVGDVEIQLRLNEDGSLKARVFNRENDISYIGEGVGYTQGIGLTYEVDFNNFKELIRKIINSKKEKTDKKSKDEIPDSDLTPEFIQFTEQRQKKSTEKPKNETELVPEIN
ncbi:translocation/assembly module TamB domain-containing protein [Flavobacterium sp.]|uniref:translocation/assembly module TamB domain-containing protein n=1 Tax=Flavobacterium sp. TaxID=239 RepID=UPI00286D8DEE|nr:translocation/assembly module TamB domain-containing protein [Flavobacterium sp.]